MLRIWLKKLVERITITPLNCAYTWVIWLFWRIFPIRNDTWNKL